MLDWLETLSWYEKILWSVSIIATILFLLQLLTTVIVENPRRKREKIFSRFFSFKNICAFLSMMGWVSISCIYQGFSLSRSEEHTSELQSRGHLVCRLLLEK